MAFPTAHGYHSLHSLRSSHPLVSVNPAEFWRKFNKVTITLIITLLGVTSVSLTTLFVDRRGQSTVLQTLLLKLLEIVCVWGGSF